MVNNNNQQKTTTAGGASMPNLKTYGSSDHVVVEEYIKPHNNMSSAIVDSSAGRFVGKLFRRKMIDTDTLSETKFSRCLNLFDLTALGIGSTLGAGIYVVAGQVAKEVAGPAVIFSFLIAAIASVFAGLCYAEFGSRVPKTGSAYIYSYVTVGEIWAFVIGWNLILEYMIGASSVARAWSGTLDNMLNKRVSNALKYYMPLNTPQLSEYPDFLAFGITIFATFILIVGVKSSSRFNNTFTMLNVLVVLFVIVSGTIKGNLSYWRVDPQTVLNRLNTTNSSLSAHITHENLGKGGFAPFGFSGILSGAATCFYAFIGFDAIATTGEEVKNPQRTLPISIILSLLCCFLAYIGVSVALTLLMPYYALDPNVPIPYAFSYIGWNKVEIIISVGSICGLSTSLMGSMFPLPRVIYAMATDGLIFRIFARVNPRLHTPILATICAGTFAGAMAMIFDLKELVDMMSIGTLLAYSLVAICILLLRYRPNESSIGYISSSALPLDEIMLSKSANHQDNLEKSSRRNTSLDPLSGTYGRALWRNLFFPKGKASAATSRIVSFFTCIMCTSIVLFCLIMVKAEAYVFRFHIFALISLGFFGLIILVCFIIIMVQPQNQSKLNFKVPWVPLIPFLSIFINIYLMMKLGVNTWIRFSVWMTIGFLIYFCYGISHSSERDAIKNGPKSVIDFNDDKESSKFDRVETQLTLVPSELDIKRMKTNKE